MMEGSAEAPARVIAAQLGWQEAWQRVQTKAGMPGADGVAVSRFARTVPASLRVLEAQLASGEYRPLPLRVAAMSKNTGATRVLLVPCVRDRIAQTAVAAWLGRRWDEHFDPASFAYRPGLGVHAALRRLRELYASGCRWVFDADIRSCFDSIDHTRLLVRLEANLGAQSPLCVWLRAWLAAPVWTGAEIRRVVKGVPQGSPLSPLLANFYLDGFDRTLRAAGVPFVRYADDFLVLARSPFDLREYQKVAHAALDALGLELNQEKTRTTTFEQRFRFVGAEIQGEAILLPFEKKKAKLSPSFVAERMPRTLLATWRAGRLTEAGPFDPGSAAAGSACVPRAASSPGRVPPLARLAGARGPALDSLRRRP